MGNRRKRNAGSGGNKGTSDELEVNEHNFCRYFCRYFRSSLLIDIQKKKAVREWGILEVLKRTLGVPLQGPPTQKYKSKKSITPWSSRSFGFLVFIFQSKNYEFSIKKFIFSLKNRFLTVKLSSYVD